jgi:hypothetical protein
MHLLALYTLFHRVTWLFAKILEMQLVIVGMVTVVGTNAHKRNRRRWVIDAGDGFGGQMKARCTTEYRTLSTIYANLHPFASTDTEVRT